MEYALMLGNKSPFQVPCRTCTQWCHSSSLVFLLILSRISAYFYCTFTVFPHNEFCFSSQISLLPASKEKKKRKTKPFLESLSDAAHTSDFIWKGGTFFSIFFFYIYSFNDDFSSWTTCPANEDALLSSPICLNDCLLVGVLCCFWFVKLSFLIHIVWKYLLQQG